MKNKLLKAAAIGVILLSTTSAHAEEISKEQIAALQSQIKQLQEQVNLLQRKQEVVEKKQEVVEKKQVEKQPNNKKAANIEYGEGGLKISSPDKKYSIKVGGYGQLDSRTYFNDKSGNSDQFLLRSTRAVFDFDIDEKFSSKIALDFGSGQSRVADGYIDYKFSDYHKIRAGKFKSPIGLERWEGDTELLFVERGLPTNLVPNRDIGIGLYGEILPEVIEYQLAITNGAADSVDSNSDTSGGKDFVGRVFANPFKNSNTTWLQGLGFGVAGSIGQRDGTTTSTELASSYRTTAQNNFFTYNPASGTAFANGSLTRINPQAWYYNSSFGVFAEYIKTEYEISKSTAPSTVSSLTNDAWTVAVAYVLTGEDENFNGVKPRENFDPSKGKWGAFEVAARYGKLNLDDNTFPTYATLSSSAKSIDEKIIGVNWYLNQNIKATLNFAINSFEGGAAGNADRPDEKSVISRVQFKF
jgi:phosphate-selective porin OprO/OprP